MKDDGKDDTYDMKETEAPLNHRFDPHGSHPGGGRILESGPRILESGPRILKHFEVRPKDFKAFRSRPGFILFVLFVYFYLFLFISMDFY